MSKTEPVTASPARRGPRGATARTQRAEMPGLSRAAIVQAALAEVSSEGLTGLSIRRVAQRLGCEAMSLYHHVPGKAHLLDALVDHALETFDWPAPEVAPEQRLREAMFAFRAMAHRYPALFPLLAVHRLNTPTGVRFIEGILGLVQAVVPDAEKAARHFRTMGYFLVGAGLDETAGYAKGPSAAQPVTEDFIVRECPRLAASSRYFQAGEWDVTFAMGVDAVIAAALRDTG